MKTIDQLYQSLSATAIVRMHHRPYIKPNTVGHHTCNMAVLAYYIFDGEPPKALTKAIVYHDLHEYHTGDIPHPAKRHESMFQAVRAIEDQANMAMGLSLELGAYIKAVLDVLDGMEFMYYMQTEYNMGNQLTMGPWNIGRANVRERMAHLENLYVPDYAHCDPMPKLIELERVLQPKNS